MYRRILISHHHSVMVQRFSPPLLRHCCSFPPSSSFEKKFRSIDQDIYQLARMEPTRFSLQQMKSFATTDIANRLKVAKFLHRELQIRFARALYELSDLPLGLSETESVQKAMMEYVDFFEKIKETKVPDNEEEDNRFVELLDSIKKAGSNIVPLVSSGVYEMKTSDLGQSALHMQEIEDDIDSRLDKFFLARIGIRMLIGQHVESKTRPGGRVQFVNVEDIVDQACSRARSLCLQYFGKAPEVEVKVANTGHRPFLYVESHLHHMIFELVKNSMRASVEMKPPNNTSSSGPLEKIDHVMDINSPLLSFVIPEDICNGVSIYPPEAHSSGLPPIRIVISKGGEDLTVKVSDEAGGICRSNWHKLHQYTYSTSPFLKNPDADGEYRYRNQFSGGGYGIPIARLFARYFGGNITWISLEGYGTDAYIQVPRLGNNMELIPGSLGNQGDKMI